jgi:hypothetical protein
MGPLGKAKWMKLVVENLANGDAVAAASSWSPPDPFKNVTTADMELARTLAATGEYRAAKHFDLPIVHKGNNQPKDLERLKTIIKTWLSNKVLKIEERKDKEDKVREFMVPGSFKPDTPAHSDDD